MNEVKLSKVKCYSLSHVRLSAIPWTVAHQATLSMGFSRQEYWSGLPVPSPGDLPDPGIKSRSPALQGDMLPSEPPGKSSSLLKNDRKCPSTHGTLKKWEEYTTCKNANQPNYQILLIFHTLKDHSFPLRLCILSHQVILDLLLLLFSW